MDVVCDSTIELDRKLPWLRYACGAAIVTVFGYRFAKQSKFEDIRFNKHVLPVKDITPARNSQLLTSELATMNHSALIVWLKSLDCNATSLSEAVTRELTGQDVVDCLADDGHAFSALDKLTWLGLAPEDGRQVIQAVSQRPASSTVPSGDDGAISVAQAVAKVTSKFGRTHKKTNSGYGLMLGTPSRLMHAWLDACASQSDGSKPCLELGAAYGVATLPALTLGTAVIANDRDQTQLDTLASHWQQLQPAKEAQLTLLQGIVPDALVALPDQSVSHVLAANILHFLPPTELERCLRELKRVMVPGSLLFVEADSPYIAGLGPLYVLYTWRRWLGSKYPGSFVFGSLLRALAPDYFNQVDHYHLLDTNVLKSVLQGAAFRPEVLDYWSVEDGQDVGTTHSDGREIMVAMARA
eukprot:m.57571 g.57571  ORF g.57571 m.57571 type:complete len:412 (-) comp13734_c0_seq1:48-1283(-)